MKKVFCIGSDHHYFKNVITGMQKTYGEGQVKSTFIEKNLAGLFKAVCDFAPDVIIYEAQFFSLDKIESLYQMLRYTAKTITPKFIIIIPEGGLKDSVKRIGCGDFVYFYESFEILDLLNCVSFLFENKKSDKLDVVEVNTSLSATAGQTVRIKSLTKVNAVVESDALLPIEKKISFPQFEKDFCFTSLKIKEQRREDIQSFFNYQFIADYEFDSPNLSIDVLRENKSFPITKKIYKALEEAEKKKKLVFKKEEVVEVEKTPDELQREDIILNTKIKRLKELSEKSRVNDTPISVLSIYDDESRFIESAFSKKFKTSNCVLINRDSCINPLNEIRDDKPDILIVNHSKKLNFEVIKNLIASFTQYKDYFPFVLLFNFETKESPEQLRDDFAYHFVIATKAPFNEDFVLKMLMMYRKKKAEKELDRTKRVKSKVDKAEASAKELDLKYFHNFSIRNHLYDEHFWGSFDSSCTILKMSEYLIEFSSIREIENQSVINIKDLPIALNLLVFKQDAPGKYYGVIFGKNEKAKVDLRKFINSLIK